MMSVKKKKIKKIRNPDALNAIVERKGGPHQNKSKKRTKRLINDDV